MNEDQQNPQMNTWIEPELEARIVAWVAGEASPFEVAELERLVVEKPELAIFKRRIEAVHGLVGRAAKPDAEPTRMSEERRAKLLAAIGGKTESVSAGVAPVVSIDVEVGRRPRRKWWQAPSIYYIAGSVAACLAALLSVPTFQTVRSAKAVRPGPVAIEMSAARPETLVNVQGVTDKPGEQAGNEVRSAVDENTMRLIADARAKREVRARSIASPTAPPPPMDRFVVTPPAREADASNMRVTFSASGGGGGRGAAIAGASGVSGTAAFNMPTEVARAGAPVTPSLPAESLSLRAAGTVVPNSSADSITFGNKIGTPAWSYADAKPVSMSGAITSNGALQNSNAGPTQVAGGSTLQVSNGLTLGSASATVGQSIGVAGKEDALSPFQVTVSSDHGYAAATTIAGTRLRSELKDSAASITVEARDAAGKKLSEAGTPPPVELVAGSGGLFSAGANGFSGVTTGGTVGTLAVGAMSNGASPSASTLNGGAVKLEAFEVAAAPAAAPAPVMEAAKATPPRYFDLEKQKDADDAKRPAAAPEPPPSSDETSTAKEPVSTFSLHVSDVAFRLAQAAMAGDKSVTPDRIRPEEFYNAFDYGDPSPTPAEKVSCHIEQAAHPFLQQRNLVRIAMKVAASGRLASQALRLTVLLDTSGSMEREDRATTSRRALEVLASLLGPNDRLTLIGFARTPRLIAEAVTADQAPAALDAAARTPAEGGTNLEAALKLATELAQRHRLPGARNRIVLITDGAANLGNADPARLAATIELLRQGGIAFDACGVGRDGIDDAMLEPLTRKGDGRYYVIDSPEAADAGFARQLAGAFRPAAENVKVQVRFNPARVASYRLIGFEKHRLNETDFRNDAVDAAELAAEENAVAVYQVEPLPQGEGELGEVSMRFRDPAASTMVERTWALPYDARTPTFDHATPSMQLAGLAALFTEKLRGTPLAEQFKLKDLVGAMNQVRASYPNQRRVQEFAEMFERGRREE